MTEILLDVTTEMIKEVSTEVVNRARMKGTLTPALHAGLRNSFIVSFKADLQGSNIGLVLILHSVYSFSKLLLFAILRSARFFCLVIDTVG